MPAESQIQELFCSSVKFDHKISISARKIILILCVSQKVQTLLKCRNISDLTSLEARAEILTKISWFYDSFEDTKMTFRN